MITNKLFLQSVSLARQCSEFGYWTNLPFYLDLLSGKEIVFDSSVTFFVGENGCGKSTLIEAIAVAMGYNAEGGSKNFNFSTKNTTSNFCDEIRLVRANYEKDGYFLRAESFYNLATNIDDLKINIDYYGGKSLHNQSHGESFLSLIQNRFGDNGFYILDEPEAALSPMRQLTLLFEINNLAKRNCQFIIATHSPILLAFPGANIYNLDEGIQKKAYTETDHYRITKGFLDNPTIYLRELFKSE